MALPGLSRPAGLSRRQFRLLKRNLASAEFDPGLEARIQPPCNFLHNDFCVKQCCGCADLKDCPRQWLRGQKPARAGAVSHSIFRHGNTLDVAASYGRTVPFVSPCLINGGRAVDGGDAFPAPKWIATDLDQSRAPNGIDAAE